MLEEVVNVEAPVCEFSLIRPTLPSDTPGGGDVEVLLTARLLRSSFAFRACSPRACRRPAPCGGAGPFARSSAVQVSPPRAHQSGRV